MQDPKTGRGCGELWRGTRTSKIQGGYRSAFLANCVLQAAAANAAAEAETEEGDDEGRASNAAAGLKESYDYLLSMAIYSLTWEKVQVRTL